MGLNTQQDPIGIAGGLNLYGYANGDPVNFSDPFGLKTQVGCRPAMGDNEDGGGAGQVSAHCAVRVVDDERGIDITIELAPDRWLNKVVYTGDSDSDRTKAYDGEWFDVAVPDGMTGQEFDDAVLKSALAEVGRAAPRQWRMGGSSNSNRFVYNIITKAGGRVPAFASQRFLFAPGICGGTGPFRGTRCR